MFPAIPSILILIPTPLIPTLEIPDAIAFSSLLSGEYLDILAISCDSFNPETNAVIGRQQGSRQTHLESLQRVRSWCQQYKVCIETVSFTAGNVSLAFPSGG